MPRGKICGTYCALLVLFLSIWGVVQLAIMAIAFYHEAFTLHQDLPDIELPINPEDIEEFYKKVSVAYKERAYNCWFAATMYLVLLLISAHQLWINHKLKAIVESKTEGTEAKDY